MATDQDCTYVHHYNSSQAKCDFVKNNALCNETEGYVNYVLVIYCDFDASNSYLAIILLALWLLVLFVGLAVTADDYCCPNLATISKTLR